MAKPHAFQSIPKDIRMRYLPPITLAVSEGNYDGDTLTVCVYAWWGSFPFVDIRIRDLYMPELSAPFGRAARDELVRLLAVGTLVELRDSVKAYAQDTSFTRIVASVYLLDGRNVAEIMRAWLAAQQQ